jgi:hypothetical protein
MKTIAEWAEDAATVRTLAEIGVDYVQGYAVARSQPPEKLLAASSSASFIKGEDVLQLVTCAGGPARIRSLRRASPVGWAASAHAGRAPANEPASHAHARPTYRARHAWARLIGLMPPASIPPGLKCPSY